MEYIGKIEDDDKLFHENQIVIYGAGKIGKKLVKVLEEKGYRKKIVAFCDGNQQIWNKMENGILVISLEEAVRRYPEAAYLIGSCCVRQMAEALAEAGISKIHVTRV